MPLSCSCGDDDYEWLYTVPEEYSQCKKFKRRKRCSSCKALISEGDTCAIFEISRGDTEYLADEYLCERCSDLYFSLYDLGYECIDPAENVVELVREYAENNAKEIK